jgi:hypothetical protein
MRVLEYPVRRHDRFVEFDAVGSAPDQAHQLAPIVENPEGAARGDEEERGSGHPTLFSRLGQRLAHIVGGIRDA